MHIQRLEVSNFMPFFGSHEVLFPDVGNRNVMLVWGNNEHGKTSILNAVRWCLFGYALGRHRKRYELADMVNIDAVDGGDWRMEARLFFVDGSDEYEMVRVIDQKPLIPHPSRDTDFDLRVEMKRNGQPLSDSEIQFRLNRIMPEAVSRFYLFDGELLQEYEDLLSENSAEIREIKQAIEHVLGVPALTKGRDELHTLAGQAKKTQAKENKGVKATQAAAERQLEVQAQIEVVTADRDELREQVREIQDEIEIDQIFLEGQEGALRVHAKIQALKEELKDTVRRSEDLRMKKAGALEDAWKDLIAAKVAERLKDLRSAVAKRDNVLREAGDLAKRIGLLEGLIGGDPCGVCGAPPGSRDQDSLFEEIESLRGLLEDRKAESEVEEDLVQRLAALSSITTTGAMRQLRQIESESAEALVRITQIENQLQELTEEIKGFDSTEAQRARGRISQKSKLVGRLEQKVRDVEERIKVLEAEETELSRLMARSSEGSAVKANREAEVFSGLTEVFSKGVDFLRDRLLEKVEAEASASFLSLTAEKAYTGLTINKNYGLSIRDHQNRIVPLRSSGAEQIVAMSLIQALNRVSDSSGPLIVDTPLSRLDPRHRRNILTSISSYGEQVVLLAHEGELPPEVAYECLGDRISREYEIERITPTQSRLNSRVQK